MQYTALSHELVYILTLVMLPVYTDYEQNAWKKEIVAHAYLAAVFLLIYSNIMCFVYLMFVGPVKFKIDRTASVLGKIQLGIRR